MSILGVVKWENKLRIIYTVLEDAEEKQITNSFVKSWLVDLQNLAYDVEDILDEFSTVALERKLSDQPTETSTSKSPKERSNKVNRSDQRLSTTSLPEAHVYGRKEDQEAIIELLLNDEIIEDGISIIPIVGIGGVGKTTLAQNVYNDARVTSHSDLKGWACVSDDFDVTRVTKAILQLISSTNGDRSDLNKLQVQLEEKLLKKKFLIILDDIWNENYNMWTSFLRPFRAGSLRNFIGHPNLKEVGEKIVNKCHGLPLAAKTLGGLLRSNVNRNDWERILYSNIWDLPQERSDIIPALKLSYHYLPPHLKQCFAYCSLLPKDYEFQKEEVILLWMAHGFLQQEGSAIQMEDLGEIFLFRMENTVDDDKQNNISKNLCNLSYAGSRYDGIKKFETVYGANDFSNLSYNGRLHNKGEGTLRISGLENINDVADAKEADLSGKSDLRVLLLKWSNSVFRNEEMEMQVHDMLRPNQKLEQLTIDGYGGISLPVGQLSSLKKLYIQGMCGIKTVSPEFYANGCFPSLETHHFKNMGEWKEWISHGIGQEVKAFPHLQQLLIVDCPKLQGMLSEHLPSLKRLVIKRCRELSVLVASLPVGCRLSEEEVEIVGYEAPTSFLHMVLDSICLTKLPQALHNLNFLRRICISNCSEWVSFPEAALSSHLRAMDIGMPSRHMDR
ncbi:hypothetical protein JRO89_XS07G0159500 [Xanthoceras sorbifolium]|uniref:Disease resistance RPP13-like protein 1 n=1 Tax=Xanthoceras sorbifolium TaxID=99658 RepID=A0ABQ8HU51_9ROSI|nr:hypothetical protein JRO89_XS07G0159500 [Xanthoceras sorbifolium]